LLCGHELDPNRLSVRSSVRFDDGWDIECAICGRCSITMEAELEIRELSERERADLASWVREQAVQGRKPPTICSSNYEGSDGTADYRVNQILETLIPRDMADRLDRILSNLAAMTGEPGENCSVTPYDIYACYSTSEHQMRFLLKALEERWWVRIIGSAPILQVTPSGWIRVGELNSRSAKPTQAFVAMSFTDALEPAWDDGIYKGVRASGVSPHSCRQGRAQREDLRSGHLRDPKKRFCSGRCDESSAGRLLRGGVRSRSRNTGDLDVPEG